MFVGNELPETCAAAPRVALGERALIPPFADTHQHFASFSAFNAGLNVMEAESNEEILRDRALLEANRMELPFSLMGR